MNMKITEQERMDKLSKYSGNTVNELLSYLKRNLRIYDVTLNWKQEPMKFVVIDDKSYRIESHKKYLVNRIDQEIQDTWGHLEDGLRRRTIKKFLDGISL